MNVTIRSADDALARAVEQAVDELAILSMAIQSIERDLPMAYRQRLQLVDIRTDSIRRALVRAAEAAHVGGER